MKKLLITGLMLCGLFSASYADIKYEFYGGMNSSSLSNIGQASSSPEEGPLDTKSKLGFVMGGKMIIPITKSFNFETGLAYSQKGSKATGQASDSF